ncbi:MAG: pyridoxal-phosphate dependent enzyme [Balneolia bacterium]|nr:pyridoxal-phosphate dependent enzyme [Balneolia bacterium]
MTENINITLDDIRQADGLIRPFTHRTPVLTSSWLDDRLGTELYFKCENFQKTGAFKARGAMHAILRLSDNEAKKGVATHSSGNHAAALARAARSRGIPAYIVMPENAPSVKVKAVESYEGQITFCESTLDSREETLQKVVEETGAVFIPPYNHRDVILGQATCALELLEDHPELDIIMAPVGGGGLLSGTALSAKFLKPTITVYGAEPEQANDAWQSLKAGKLIPSEKPNTIADGLRTSLGPITFSIISRQVDDIITVSETQILKSMRDVWERMKIIIEPSCSVPLAAVETRPELFRDKKVGIILTGGNVDLDKLPWL